MAEAGGAAEVAKSALSIDAKTYLQDPAEAVRAVEWVASQTTTPLATVSNVRVPFDPRLQLGDLVALVCDGAGIDDTTDKISKAIVTGIHLTGTESSIEQTLDLAFTGVTFADLDRVLAGMTFAQGDVLFACMTFADLDRWITIEGIPS